MPTKNRSAKRVGQDDGHPVKKARVDPMVGAILEAVDLTQDLPSSCKNMLAAMVPEAFTVPADERHSYQTMFVDIVGECVRKTEEHMKVAINNQQENASSLSCKRETLETNIEDARKLHADKKTVMEQQKTSLAGLFKTVLENRIALSASQHALDFAAAPVAELKKEVEACHRALSEDLAELRDEAVEASAADACSRLIALAAHLKIEETLTTSLPAACNKKPADRGAFDVMVLDQFAKEVTAKAAEFRVQVDSQTAKIATLEAEVVAAQKKLDETTAAHFVASDSLHQALNEEKKTSAAHLSTVAELASFEPLLKAATEAVGEKENALASFQTWNVASYDMLKAKPGKFVMTEELQPALPSEDASPPSEDVVPPSMDAVPQEVTA